MPSILLVFAFFILSNPMTAQVNSPKLAWEFTTLEDSLGTPQTTIHLLVNGQKTLIGKGIGNFSELDKASYTETQYQIPGNALTACTGFWAGLGHHYCVIQNKSVLEVKEGFLDEEAPRGARIRYKTVQKINL